MNLEETLSGSAGLAGVQSLLTGQATRRHIHHALQDLLADGWAPSRLRLTRAKYKPGRKLNTYFTTSVFSEDHTQISTRPVAITWRAGHPEALPADDLAAAEKEICARGLADPFEQLWGQVPERGMEILVSPLDPAFPQLSRISDPAYLHEQLSRLEEPHPPMIHRVTPVRYRPGERHVLKIVASHGEKTTTLYAKLYKDRAGAARAGRIADRVTRWLDERGGVLSGARPYATLEPDAIILYPEISGTPLSTLLRQPGSGLAGPLIEAGKGLRALHDGPGSLAAELSAMPAEKEIHLIARAAEHLQALLPDGYRRIQALLEKSARLLSHLSGEPPTFTHSDFKADHLLTNPGCLTLIDFDTCSLADPALDVGKFLADLDYWYAMYGVTGSEAAQAIFLDGYGMAPLKDRMARARVYHALILVKITVRRVRLFDRKWAEKTLGLLQRADEVLNGTRIRRHEIGLVMR